MEKDKQKSFFILRFFRMLVDARWFFTMSASAIASILGISLTFGINSCRENMRVKAEVRKSMLQAVDNIKERFDDAHEWIEIIDNQNRIYSKADSFYVAGRELPDGVCIEFRYTLPYIKISAFDHEFEKIFRGSYQLWQLQTRNDSMTYYIGACYDALNTVESTCEDLTSGMIERIGIINSAKRFNRADPRQWTMALVEDPDFQYYMSVRKAKAQIAKDILTQAQNDYTANVVPRSEALRDK